MKRNIAIISVVLIMTMLLTSCAGNENNGSGSGDNPIMSGSTAQRITPTPEPLIYEDTVEVTEDMNLTFDLNGDNENEHVAFTNGLTALTIARADGSVILNQNYTEKTSFYVAQLDAAKFAFSIFVSNGSGTVCIEYDETNTIVNRHFIDGVSGSDSVTLSGRVIGVKDGKIAVEQNVEFMGINYLGYTNYVLRNGGLITIEPGARWNFEVDVGNFNDAVTMTLKRDLNVISMTLDSEAESVLKAGTKIKITATDRKGAAYYCAEDGSEGRFTFMLNVDGSITMTDGTSPSDTFTIGGGAA